MYVWAVLVESIIEKAGLSNSLTIGLYTSFSPDSRPEIFKSHGRSSRRIGKL